MEPELPSFSAHLRSVGGFSTGVLELSTAMQEKETVEPGVYTSFLGDISAWSKTPVGAAFVTMRRLDDT